MTRDQPTPDAIKHENGPFWVLDTTKAYQVMVTGPVASTCDSAYSRTDDGLSVAICRCDYLARVQRKRATCKNAAPAAQSPEQALEIHTADVDSR